MSNYKIYTAIVSKKGLGIYDDDEKLSRSRRFIKGEHEIRDFNCLSSALKYAIALYQRKYRKDYTLTDMPTLANLKTNWFYHLQI